MWALTRIEIKLALREPLTLIVSIAFPLMLLVVLLGVFGNQPDDAFAGSGGTDHYVPAYAAAVIASAGLIGLPLHVASYREQGIMRRFDASGVSRSKLLVAQASAMLLTVAIGTALMLAVGFGAYELSAPVDTLGVVAGLGLGWVAFASIGFGLGSVLPSARAAQATGLLAFLGMFFIAGGGPPEALLPAWMVTASELLPLTYLIDAIRSPWVGTGWDLTALAVLSALALLAALAPRLAPAAD